MQFWFFFILTVVYGACIGSFLNVVIYRLPEGRSLWHPPSQCPKCGHRLAWYDNVPVLGWIRLGGKCRYCRTPISFQYPLVEAVTAALFGFVMLIYYRTELRPEFAEAGLIATWPVFAVHLVLVASLVAATVIDARLYIIPQPIPWTATVVALLGLPIATMWSPETLAVTFPVREGGFGAAAGGLVGLAIGVALLRWKVLPQSFDELMDEATHGEKLTSQQEQDILANPDEWPVHPHPRREVLKEALFLAFPVVGAIVGWWWLAPEATPPTAQQILLLEAPMPLPQWMTPAVQVFGGAAMGYLVGAALVWGIRVLGTLGFGKEAMGLGDVHLLGAIGAVLGPIDVVLVFFVAPFLGLAAALMANFSEVLKGKLKVIPYGPYLALAALIVMVLREQLLHLVPLDVLM